MIIDDLQKTVKQLKQLDILESAVQDAEKKIKNDEDYDVLVSDFWISMKKFEYANSELDFKLADESLELANEIVNKLDNVISSGAVDEEELVTAKQQINRKLNPGLAKEWKAFHQKKTSGVVAKISTVGSLVQDQNKILSIRETLSNSSEWSGLSLKDNGVKTRLESLKDGIDEIDKIEEELDLSPEIRQFVMNVSKGKARATEVTDTIVSWINKSGLQDKFIISFKKI